jgi:Flp pilus assembly protein TadG
MRRRTDRGAAFVEFALVAPFMVSLIVGTMTYGVQLLRELELQNVARDTASMCARGASFASQANQNIVSRLGQELKWPSTGGLTSTSPGVVYVSTIKYLDSTCNGATPVCSNAGNWVFVRSVAFGNTSLRTSNFGAPPSCLPGCYDTAQNDGSLKANDTLNNSNAIVKNFSYLGTPSTNVAGFQPGQPTFLVEAAAVTGPWTGAVGYAFAIF